MSTTPHVFISATTGDLGPTRQIVKDTLLTMGCHPVEQSHFTPESGTVEQMLEAKIRGCHALIHIVGERFGAAPQPPATPSPENQVTPSKDQRSYTQLEREIAGRLKIPVYLFLCSDGFPYETATDPEPEELRALQTAYRTEIQGQNQLYTPVATPEELVSKVKDLQFQAQALETTVTKGQKTNFAALIFTILLLLALGGGGWFAYQHLGQKITAETFDPDALRTNLEARILAEFQQRVEEAGGDQAKMLVILELEENRDTRLAQIDSLITTITEGFADGASPIFQRATAILKNEGPDAAIQYLQAQQPEIEAEADQIQAQIDADQARLEANRKRLRTTLEPLLMQADLHETNLEWEPALALYRDVTQRAPHWFRARRELGMLLRDLAKVEEAEPHLREALDLAETDADRALALNSLAGLLYNLARHAEAEPLFREALALYERLYSPDSTEVATVRNNLGLLLWETNHLEEAEEHFRRALAIDEASYGPDHPNVAIRLNSLGALLYQTNRLEEAEEHYRRALAIDEASYGPDHPSVAIRLNNLGMLLKETNRLEEAEEHYRRALATDEASYGPDHPNVARGLNNLGMLLLETNRVEEAEEHFRRALVIDEASYGPDHPNVAICLNNLGELLRQTNRLEEAEEHYRRALAIDEASYGPHHPNVARKLNNLGLLLRQTNRLEEAEEHFRRALAIDEASYGPDHPNVAIKKHNLAVLLRDADQPSKADLLFRDALEVANGSWGPDHPNTSRLSHQMAKNCLALGNLIEAKQYAENAMVFYSDYRRQVGSEHRYFEETKANYGEILRRMGKTEAEIAAAVEEILKDEE